MVKGTWYSIDIFKDLDCIKCIKFHKINFSHNITIIGIMVQLVQYRSISSEKGGTGNSMGGVVGGREESTRGLK